jgi:hypothetical protein
MLIDDKIKSIQDQFQLKFDLMENANKTALSHLQQEQTQKNEENKQLKEKLARLEAELNRVTDNDLNYDSPDDDNDTDDNNDINYDTECSDEEKDTIHSTGNLHQNTRKYVSNEVFANTNYDSSDNEERTNDICLD